MTFFSYLTSAVRTLPAKGRRNGLKVLTLGIGLSVGLVLAGVVSFRQTFDNFYTDADRIYYLSEAFTQNGEARVFPQTSGGIAPTMAAHFPQIEGATRFRWWGDGDAILVETKERVHANLIFLADTAFFHILDRPVVAGDITESLAVPENMVVSMSLARRLYHGTGRGDYTVAEAVVGTRLSFAGQAGGTVFTVAGVYADYPYNANWRPEAVVSLGATKAFTGWDGTMNMVGNDSYRSFIKLHRGADVCDINDHMESYVNAYLPVEEAEKHGFTINFMAKPFKDFHSEDASARNLTLLLAFVAFALLLTSVLNYMLIVVSTSVTRSREMALRKCLGSGVGDTFRMMFAEAVIHMLLALALAAILVYAARGLVEQLAGVSPIALFTGEPLRWAVGIVVTVVLLNGLVPGILFNRIPVAVAFRGYAAGRRTWKRGLLATEFAAAAFLAVVITIVALQYRLMTRADLGFKYDNVASIMMPEATKAQKLELIEAVRALPCVDDAAFAYQNPFDGCSGDNVSLPDDPKELFNIRDFYYVDEHYWNVMGIALAEGRNFNPELGIDQEIIVSRSFADALRTMVGWDNVVGQQVRVTDHEKTVSTIVGVFDDIHTGTFDKEGADHRDRPMGVFFCNPEKYTGMYPYVFVKYHQLDTEALEQTQAVVGRVLTGQSAPLVPFRLQVLDNFADTLRLRNAILIGGIVTLLIALLGLTGYTIDEAKRRAKEIAIRRVCGYQLSIIRRMFLRDIMLIALPSVATGCLVAAIVAGNWEQQFTLKAGLPVWVFAVVVVTILCIVALVSDGYVRHIASVNPAKTLKME